MERPQHFSGPYTLTPDTVYTVNGTTYHTDSAGRITQFDGQPRTESAPRSLSAQRHLPGKLPGEDAGHYMAASQGGSGKADNLGRMDHMVNVRDYRAAERETAALLQDGKQVTLHGSLYYSGTSSRPDCILLCRESADPATGKTDTEYLSWSNTDMSLFDGDDSWLATAEGFDNPGAKETFGPENGEYQGLGL